MRTTSIVQDKLKTFDYYKNKLPMYLQQSYGFLEHFQIWYDILNGDNNKGLIGQSDILLNLLNIFDEDYFTWCEQNIIDFQKDGTVSDILDKLGLLFGVNRHLAVEYVEDDVTKKERLVLDNQDFLVLIKCQIIKNYCEGTAKQINAYYKDVGIRMYVLTSNTPATANLYLDKDTNRPNLTKLFLAGLLHIESMGIKYNLTLFSSNIGIWDESNWDEGVWSI